MKKKLAMLVAAAIGACALMAGEVIPWRVPSYSLTARNMPVNEALATFGVAQNVPVVMSESVRGVFSGTFTNVPAALFLDRLTTMHNLMWYYDGATIWVCSSGENATTLIDLKYMKAAEVQAMMRELGVEDSRYPLKTASNNELIMVSGPPRYVTLVSEMIEKADRLREMRTFNEVETRLFPLVHTWADNVNFNQSGAGLESSSSIRGVAYLLQEIMTAGVDEHTRENTNEVDGAQAKIPRATPVIRPENRMNAVLVRDSVTRMPMYEKLIRQLDRPQKLVEIDVTVLEISREDALDWQMSLGVTGKDSKNKAGAGMNVDNLVDSESLTGSGASAAYSYLGKHVDVNASLLALKSKGKARNIARTSLLTMNNMTAELSDTESYSAKLVGEKVASVSETSAGTRLAVKPRVIEPPPKDTTTPRQVWLTMELQDGGLDMLATVDSLPTKRTTKLETQASLPEGESLLMAGYFKDIDEDSGWGIPYLRDIPVIGWLFGGHSQTKQTIQRMFILTPHVLDPFSANTFTQDVATVQMLRQRDIEDEEVMADTVDRDDLARKEREASTEEKRTIRHEKFDETYERNEKERELRKEQRKHFRRDDHQIWESDYNLRREAWERAHDD